MCGGSLRVVGEPGLMCACTYPTNTPVRTLPVVNITNMLGLIRVFNHESTGSSRTGRPSLPGSVIFGSLVRHET